MPTLTPVRVWFELSPLGWALVVVVVLLAAGAALFLARSIIRWISGRRQAGSG